MLRNIFFTINLLRGSQALLSSPTTLPDKLKYPSINTAIRLNLSVYPERLPWVYWFPDWESLF